MGCIKYTYINPCKQFTTLGNIFMLKKAVLLTLLLVGTMFFQKVIAADVSQNEVKAIIVKQSIELGIDPALGLSIAKTESNFRHNSKSPYGAVGVFQLMPATARNMGLNPYYLSDNIRGGLMYYKMMYKMFGSTELALAAYNAGPLAVARHKAVPSSTKGFVNSIMADYRYYIKNPDQAIIQAKRKAPAVNVKPRPVVSSKPSVTIHPNTSSNKANLSKHQLQMIDVSATKSVKDSLI